MIVAITGNPQQIIWKAQWSLKGFLKASTEYNTSMITPVHRIEANVKMFVTMPSNQQARDPVKGVPTRDPQLVRTSALNLYNKILMEDLFRSRRNNKMDTIADSGNKMEHKDSENMMIVSPLAHTMPSLNTI